MFWFCPLARGSLGEIRQKLAEDRIRLVCLREIGLNMYVMETLYERHEIDCIPEHHGVMTETAAR